MDPQNPTPADNHPVPAPTPAPAPRGGAWRTVLLIVLAVASLGAYFSVEYFNREQPQAGPQRLKTGGTSVVSVILQNRWRAAFLKDKNVQVDYESTGSTKGVAKLIDREYALAFSHAPLSKEQQEKIKSQGQEVLQLPVLVCGVVPVYNVKELKGKAPLNFSGELLADIFLGKVDSWDHAAIKKLNPNIDLPKTKIAVIHRADSSGTTQLFTEYLAAESAAWKDKVGPPASEIKWPVGDGVERSLGIIEKVFNTEGAISYADRLFTSYEEMDLNYGAVENKDRSGFIRAEPENMTAAMRSALKDIPETLAVSLADQPGKDSYPISGVIYALCFTNHPSETKTAIMEFMTWVLHDGQKIAGVSRYAALPPELVEKVEAKLKQLRTGP